MSAELFEYIREHGDDLTARGAYADWLEESGEPELADLARLGCEWRALPDDDPRRLVLGDRLSELWKREQERCGLSLI